MDRKLLKQLRKMLLLESFFSGTSRLSKTMEETEKELQDLFALLEEKTGAEGLNLKKLFKK